jgi:hypothetical protein
MLQVQHLVEIPEESLAAAQHDRCERDQQLLDVSGERRLADDVRPAMTNTSVRPTPSLAAAIALSSPSHEDEPASSSERPPDGA